MPLRPNVAVQPRRETQDGTVGWPSLPLPVWDAANPCRRGANGPAALACVERDSVSAKKAFVVDATQFEPCVGLTVGKPESIDNRTLFRPEAPPEDHAKVTAEAVQPLALTQHDKF